MADDRRVWKDPSIDTVLVQITGTRHGIPGTEVQLDPAAETLSGLRKICYVSCTNIMTADLLFIDQKIGILSATAMSKIEECLKKVLEIP